MTSRAHHEGAHLVSKESKIAECLVTGLKMVKSRKSEMAERAFSCPWCPLDFESVRSLCTHLQETHPQEWLCALSMLTRALRPSLADSHARIELPCLGFRWPALPYNPEALEPPTVAVWSSVGREGASGHVDAQQGQPGSGLALLEGLLMGELDRKNAEVHAAKKDKEKLRRAKDELEERNAQLKRQLTIAAEMMAGLRQEVMEKHRELTTKERQVCELSVFLRDTALKEADAKLRLQEFIEELLERAETRSQSVSVVSRHTYQQHMSPDKRWPRGVKRTLSLGSCVCERGCVCGRRWCLCERGCVCVSSDEGDDTWSADTSELSLWPHTPSRDISQAVCPFCAKQSQSQECVCMVLRCVFAFLDTHTLLNAAVVCRAWRNVARHPSLWIRVTLENTHVSSTLLISLSRWCNQTRSLTMRNLTAPRRHHEDTEEHYRNTRGCLESGLEVLLRATGRSLVELTVTNCPNILTDRCVWLASCYCRSLQTLTYRSATDPVGPEVIWALGAGCRNITSLQVAPLQPCLQPSRFGNRCLQLIGRCWPQLCEVGVGGAGCGVQGLASLVKSCVSLRKLQLHGVCEVSVALAQHLCREGLRCLETLEFHSTPVSPDGLLHFHSMCGQLRCVLVQVNISDYFQNPDREEAHRHFNQTINKMQALQSSILSGILHLRLDRC
ncbi:F-box only protein 41-like [Clupea harengus]|uniref:F-box only protein 41-like n=1 Tax=Clupea harengus TaxID=7950 RepID=A0A6P8GZC6_CLUHA|nr:F-box only protein 41-like [Clupea harengus]